MMTTDVFRHEQIKIFVNRVNIKSVVFTNYLFFFKEYSENFEENARGQK